MKQQVLDKVINNILDDILAVYKSDLLEMSNLHSTFINVVEYILINRVLSETSFNKKTAARILGISRTTLSNKMLKYNISQND